MGGAYPFCGAAGAVGSSSGLDNEAVGVNQMFFCSPLSFCLGFSDRRVISFHLRVGN